MINTSKRNLMKGLAYSAAVVGSGASSLLWASSNKKVTAPGDALPSCDLTIYQHQTGTKQIITLMNLSDKTVALDEITPLGLEHINGTLVVKLNKLPNGKVKIAPSQRFSFEIEAISHAQKHDGAVVPNVLAGKLRIKSAHTAFNGVIPVTVFDSQIA